MSDDRRVEDGRVVCKRCSLYLVRAAYVRHGWFRLLREPLVFCMRVLAWWNHIEVARQTARLQQCPGCVRFMKAELDKKSPTYRFFNGLIGPSFKRVWDPMLKAEEVEEARRIAREAMKDQQASD
jgi:hypothetical protein